MASGLKVHGFQVHHIFPREIFDVDALADGLAALFADLPSSTFLDLAGNKIGLYSNADMADAVRNAIAGGDTLYTDSRLGGSVHNGSHLGYNEFLKARLTAILNSTLSDYQKQTAIYDLHQFATKVSQGVLAHNNSILGVMGDTAYAATLTAAWIQYRVDPTAADARTQNGLTNYISNLDTNQTDVGLLSNTQQRLNTLQSFNDNALTSNNVTVEQHAIVQDIIADAQASLNTSTALSTKHASALITSGFIKVSHDVAKSTGVGDVTSAKSNLEYAVAQTYLTGTELWKSNSGSVPNPDFDTMIRAASNVGSLLDSLGGRLPDSFNDLDSVTKQNLVTAMVGVGGGTIGDVAEFLNHSYESFIHGLDTGDWAPFGQDVATYGVALVFSAAILLGTTAVAAALAGPLAAAAVSATWAAYGIYDGWVNISELFNKISADQDYWADLFGSVFDGWFISPLFGEIFDPLVLDLDGDGVELNTLDGSNVHFDLNGDGFAERTGWVGSDDGLLAIDLNENGTVDGIGELFGSAEQDGFAVLETFDTNGDGVIAASDEAFDKLRIWRDLDQDGVSDAGELMTLVESGIESISLVTTLIDGLNNGHTVSREAIYTFADGSTGTAQSIFFQADLQDTAVDNTPDFTIDPEVAKLPLLPGSGQIHSIAYLATQDASFHADWLELTEDAAGLTHTALRSKFSDLLLRWAGVDGEAEGSRGQYVDAQHLAFVEKFFGTSYQEVHAGNLLRTSPGSQAFGDPIEASFDQIVDTLLTIFAAQTTSSAILRGAEVSEGLSSTYFAYALLDFGDAEDAGSPAPATPGNVGAVAELLVAMMPPDHGDAVAYLEKAFGGLEGMVGIAFSGDRAAYQAAMADALSQITDSGLLEIATAIVGGEAALGTDGTDGLARYEGNNLFEGGAGDDLLVSGTGSDTFIYRSGDGSDYIRDDSSSLVETDVLELPDLMADAVTFERVGDALQILVTATGEKVTVEDFFFRWGVENRGVDLIRFADGTELSREAVRAQTATVGDGRNNVVADSSLDDLLHADRGNDEIQISGGNDTILYAAGDGSDTIVDLSGVQSESDTLILSGLTPEDVSFTRSADALVITILATGETLTDTEFFKNSWVPGEANGWNNHGYGIDRIEFGNGTVWNRSVIQSEAQIRGNDDPNSLTGSGLNDRFVSGGGNDSLAGGGGSDTYYWSKGDGADRIEDSDESVSSADVLVLTDVSASDVALSRLGDTLRITVLSTGEVIDVADQFSGMGSMMDDAFATGLGIEFLEFENGVRWGRDILAVDTRYGSIGKLIDVKLLSDGTNVLGRYFEDEFGATGEIVISGLDIVSGGAGTPPVRHFYYSDVAGTGVGVASETEVIVQTVAIPGNPFGPLNSMGIGSDIADIMARDTGAEPIALPEDPANPGGEGGGQGGGGGDTPGVDYFDFVFDISGHNIIVGHEGNDVLVGGAGNDNLSGGEHNDLLFGDEASVTGNSVLGHDVLSGGYGDDILYGGAGDDLLDGNDGSDFLFGGDGADKLYDTGNESNTFEGGQGDDLIYAGDGADTIVYNAGDGTDILIDSSASLTETDLLKLVGIDPVDIELTKTGTDLVLKDLATGDKIFAINFFVRFDTDAQSIDEVHFDDGTVWDRSYLLENAWVRGTDLSDTLLEEDNLDSVFFGGLGDDHLHSTRLHSYMPNGNDTYLYRRGDGNDLIFDRSWETTETDTLKFTDINPNEVALSKPPQNADLLIEDLLTGQIITVRDFFWNFDAAHLGIEQIEFADGTVWDRDTINANAWTRGTETADALVELDNRDNVFFGGLGDDELHSTRVNSYMANGNDTYVYRSGDGNDLIVDRSWETSETDTLKFTDINAGDIRLSLDGNDLIVSIQTTGEQIVDRDAFWNRDSYGQGMEAFEFADGTVWDRDEISYWAQEGSAFFVGSSGADTIIGSQYDQTLNGDSGNDFIDGGDGSDLLFGDQDNDVLAVSVASVGTLDELDGGDGFDTADFSQFSAAVSVDLVQNDGEASTSDTAVHDQGTLRLVATLRNLENITGSQFADSLSGDLTDNVLTGLNGDDLLDGRSGNDTLIGGGGDDHLIGYLGIDTLEGGEDNDTLNGGLDDDTLHGGAGDDTYIYASVDGSDLIVEEGDAADLNTLSFTDLVPSDIVLRQMGDNLVVEITATGEQILVSGHFLETNPGISRVEFSDGTIWNASDIAAAIVTGNQQVVADIVGTDGADSLSGTDADDIFDAGLGDDSIDSRVGSDMFLYASGDGSDFINEENGSISYTDVLRLVDLSAGDIELRRSGVDLFVKDLTTGHEIEIDEQFYSADWWGIERIEFQDGSYWDRDTILANAWIRGDDANNSLSGTNGDDAFVAGLGDDSIDSRVGSDTFLYASGDGNDFINEENGSTNYIDVLRLTDLNAADIELRRSGVDLFVKDLTTGHEIEIDEQFYSADWWGIEKIEFQDGSFWDRDQILANAWIRGDDGDNGLAGSDFDDIFDAGLGDDNIYSTYGSDTFMYASGDGNDFIDEQNGSTNYIDILKLTDLNAADIELRHSGNDLIVKDLNTGHEIEVDEQFYNSAWYGIERIEFQDGSFWDRDTIQTNAWFRGDDGDNAMTGTSADDTFVPGLGDDSVYSTYGSDTFIYASGDGNDVIDEQNGSTSYIDILRLTDLNAADIELRRGGNDLFLKDLTTGHEIEIDEQFYNSAWYGIERIEFQDGSFWDRDTIQANAWFRGDDGDNAMTGTSANDTFYAGLGNDSIYSTYGSDTFVYASGDGNDVIDEQNGSDSYIDVLRLTDLNAADIELRYSGNDAVLKVLATGHEIEIDEQFYNSAWYGVERIEFQDGSFWDRDAIRDNAWFRGDAGDNTLSGTSVDDTLAGGLGDDTLSGLAGNDTFVFGPAFGNDTITDFTAGAATGDVIAFNAVPGLANYADILANATDDGTDTTIILDVDNSIVIQGVLVSQLNEDDFTFIA